MTNFSQIYHLFKFICEIFLLFQVFEFFFTHCLQIDILFMKLLDSILLCSFSIFIVFVYLSILSTGLDFQNPSHCYSEKLMNDQINKDFFVLFLKVYNEKLLKHFFESLKNAWKLITEQKVKETFCIYFDYFPIILLGKKDDIKRN